MHSDIMMMWRWSFVWGDPYPLISLSLSIDPSGVVIIIIDDDDADWIILMLQTRDFGPKKKT